MLFSRKNFLILLCCILLLCFTNIAYANNSKETNVKQSLELKDTGDKNQPKKSVSTKTKTYYLTSDPEKNKKIMKDIPFSVIDNPQLFTTSTTTIIGRS